MVPLPFCQITLKAEKPLKDRYSKSLYRLQLITVVATIKQKRLKLGISQAALAKRLNVGIETVANWEHSRTIPAICQGLLSFLSMTLWKPAKKLVNAEIRNRVRPFFAIVLWKLQSFS